MKTIFEAVDATSEDQYWTLGVWETLADALAALDECKEPSDFCDHHIEECCVVEIRERKLGWSGVGKMVATLQWREKYDKSKDEYTWEAIPSPCTGGEG